MRGYGYDVDAVSDHPDASLSLTFTSTNGPGTVSPYEQKGDHQRPITR